MARMLMLGAAAAALAACGSEDAHRVEAPQSAPAANAVSPPPAGDDAVATPPPAAQARGIPAAFHGVYDADRAACGRPSEYRLTVRDRELRFHESIGVVRAVTADRTGEIRVTADYQGEGQSWTNVRALQLGDGGATLTITGDGTSLSRVRCPALPAGS